MPNVMVYQPNENWQAPRGFDFYCLGGSLNKMMPVFLWVRIGSAPFGKVQASSKTDIWPRAASCKDELLALSACFVLWMVDWEALPRAKFIAPMAEEAPVWGRQIKCSMQGPGALKAWRSRHDSQLLGPTNQFCDIMGLSDYYKGLKYQCWSEFISSLRVSAIRIWKVCWMVCWAFPLGPHKMQTNHCFHQVFDGRGIKKKQIRIKQNK